VKVVSVFEGVYDAVILAVSRQDVLELDWTKLRSYTSVIYDVKGILPKEIVDGRL